MPAFTANFVVLPLHKVVPLQSSAEKMIKQKTMEENTMIEELLNKLSALAGTDDFEYESEEIMEQLQDEGAGFEIVEKLFTIIENHPLDDFGMPGAMVHYIESFYPDFLPLLIDSVKRTPTMHTVWMLNRCINGKFSREELLSALREVAENENTDKAIRDSAKSFLDYQTEK